jgi:hypothetical protein
VDEKTALGVIGPIRRVNEQLAISFGACSQKYSQKNIYAGDGFIKKHKQV